jgi:hypothetical protein
MSIAHAMWINGNGLAAEVPERLASQCFGFFQRFTGQPNTDNWLHAPIPTPVIVDAQRLRISQAMVRFRTLPGVAITSIHIYDGEKRLESYERLNLASEEWVRYGFPVRGGPYVEYGVGISIQVAFGAEQYDRVIEFSAVGCDFVL